MVDTVYYNTKDMINKPNNSERDNILEIDKKYSSELQNIHRDYLYMKSPISPSKQPDYSRYFSIKKSLRIQKKFVFMLSNNN